MRSVISLTEILSEIPLGSAITFQRGFDITKAEQTIGEIPIVSSSGVSSFHNKWKVAGPGVVIGRKGTLGTVHYLDQNFWPHDTTLWVKDFKESNPRFVAYFLKTLRLENFDTGASNPTLNRNHAHKIRVLYPKPEVQERIAAVLSAYDDLIENNRRRIALLEQMAEQLYREWFVRFRFPGYQQAKFEKGLPKGWVIGRISDVCAFKYGYTESACRDDSLPKFLRVMDINKTSTIDWSTVPNCPISDADFQKYRLTKGDLVIARMADPGKVAIIEEDVTAVFASYLIKMVYEPNKVSPYFLYFTLSSDYYLALFAGADSGATRGSINANSIGRTGVVLPPFELMRQFDERVSPIRQAITSLLRANENLSRTRDLLLPRLISGKLRVDDLDIQFPPSMQAQA